jgi:hypothetical protein
MNTNVAKRHLNNLENALKEASLGDMVIGQVGWDGARYGQGSFLVELWKRNPKGRKIVGVAQDESFSIAFCSALKILNEEFAKSEEKR